MIKAAFFDVDGTLMSHKTRSIPASTRRALEKLREKGILCVVATGRHICQFEHLPVNELDFDGYLTLNGQICLDADRRILYGCAMNGEGKDTLVKMFYDKEMPVLLVNEEGIYINFVDDRVRYVQDCISSPVAEVKEYQGEDLYMVCTYTAPEEEAQLGAAWDDCVITRWNPYALDIIAKGGGKDVAIERYLEAMGIAREESIAFGDGHNDMNMLKYVGIGVAMGNAEAEVKAIADYVTSDVDEDGIENALKHFGIID